MTRLVIGVASWEGGETKRNTIMETWGKDAEEHPEIDLVMMIGKPELTMPKREGRMLYLPCPDDYMSLPQKLRWFCLWGLAYTDAPWFFKAPDDIYCRVDRLLEITYEKRRRGCMVIGCRGGRGYKANLQGGAGYFLDRRGAMVMSAYCTKETGADDRQCRASLQKVGTRFYHSWRLYYRHTGVPLPDNDMAACHLHRWKPWQYRKLHKMFEEND